MKYYADNANGKNGGPFTDTIQIDIWANANLQIGERFVVIRFDGNKPSIYGIAQVTESYLKWFSGKILS